jgi:glycosyltransferase involved in cell wall biosynthesis
MPRVSVIVPNYNHGPFLERRLRSVLNQTYSDFELIFLDDASTDDSLEIFGRFATDARVRSEFNAINSQSPFKQWNKGVRLSTGTYIWIAESDDDAELTFLETLVPILDTHPNVGLAYCNSWMTDENDQRVSSIEGWAAWLDPERWRGDYINDGSDECARFLLMQNTIPNASAVLFRRDVYVRAGMAEETMRYCGDWLTWVRMLLTSDVAFVREPLNCYRWHNSTVRVAMHDTQTALLEHLRVALEIVQRTRVAPPYRMVAGAALSRLESEIARLKDKVTEQDRVIRQLESRPYGADTG